MFPFVRFLWMPLVVAACGDLDVKSIRTGDSVPQVSKAITPATSVPPRCRGIGEGRVVLRVAPDMQGKLERGSAS